MATWQFAFTIIPEKVLMDKNSNFQSNVKPSDFDVSMSWYGYCLSKSSLEKVSEMLEQTKSWSDDIRQFGHIDETCIELFYERNTLLDVSIRLDLRSLTSDIMKMLIVFIKENDALIITQKGVLIRPVLEDIIAEIKKSDAYSFIRNPQEFLSSINK